MPQTSKNSATATRAHAGTAFNPGSSEPLQEFQVASTSMLENATRVQKELSEFLAERIRQDMDAQAAFLRCRNIEDVRDVQSRFFQTAMDQYSEEMSRMMQLSADMMALSLPRHPR